MSPRLSPSRATGPVALVVALLALVVALGGTSYAAVTLAKNSVGTKQLKNNAVVSAKVKDGSLTAADFAAGQLPAGAKGEKGAQGAQGAAGAAGPAGTVRGWAYVSSSGTVVSSGGQYPLTTEDITKVTTGVYQITASAWGGGLLAQTFAASLVSSNGGEVNITRAFFNPITLSSTPPAVYTYTSNGAATDKGFVAYLF
jgi:hypothetical protein